MIGAGPAGLAAAVEAARGGLTVTLIDAGARFGGQFWRHGPAGLAPIATCTTTSTCSASSADRGRAVHRRGADPLPAAPSRLVADGRRRSGGRSRARRPHRPGPTGPRPCSTRDYLVLAAGAYDRQLPFPGLGPAGRADRRGGAVVAQGQRRRRRPAGAGRRHRAVPAAGRGRAGRPRGARSSASSRRTIRRLAAPPARAASRSPRRLREAAGYLATLARHRVRVRNRSMVVAAHGGDRLEAVTVARLDRPGPGRRRRSGAIAVDVLAVGYGFTAQTELALAAGCRMRVSADQTLVVVTDEQQATSQPAGLRRRRDHRHRRRPAGRRRRQDRGRGRGPGGRRARPPRRAIAGTPGRTAPHVAALRRRRCTRSTRCRRPG